MAKVELYAPFLLRWEGGFVNDPVDRGGATNMGVTLKTWRSQGYDKNGDGIIDASDLRLLTREDVIRVVLKPHYWDRWRADQIHSQSVAEALVDFTYHSGTHGIKIPQKVLGVTPDGIVGPKTIAAVNWSVSRKLFNKIQAARRDFLHGIVERDKTQKRFIKGWLNRLEALKYVEQ